jgi:tRNA (guanine-N7-)-methyltransferase
VEVLKKMTPPETFAGVHIFFPDPWPKKKHHKRRLIRPEYIPLLASRLISNGYLYIVTDWDDYGRHIRDIMENESSFRQEEEPDWRPVTAFEKKGIAKGHNIHGFLYRKSG